MDRFILEFGRFFWLWEAFGVYLVVTGLVWILLMIITRPKSEKAKGKKKKENEEVDKE